MSDNSITGASAQSRVVVKDSENINQKPATSTKKRNFNSLIASLTELLSTEPTALENVELLGEFRGLPIRWKGKFLFTTLKITVKSYDDLGPPTLNAKGKADFYGTISHIGTPEIPTHVSGISVPVSGEIPGKVTFAAKRMRGINTIADKNNVLAA